MPNTKQPFVYTYAHKMLGDQSTTTTITNSGVSKLTVQSTYTLAAPYVGALKTIYRAATLTTANTLISLQADPRLIRPAVRKSSTCRQPRPVRRMTSRSR